MSIADRFAEWLPIAWFLFAVAAAALLWTSGLLGTILQRVKKVGAFGVDFEFSEESAKQTRDTIESQLSDVRKVIRRELEADVRARSLQDSLKAVLEASSLASHDDYRAAIHIPDPLYNDWLYQLLDYHPRGAGHGRTFSTRAGIIGLAWRLGSNEQWSHDSGIDLDDLIQKWGMTRPEADRRRVNDETKVMLAITLKDPTGTWKVGILYLDSKSGHRFGEDDTERELFMTELSSDYESQISESLSDLVESAKRRSPQLSLDAG